MKAASIVLASNGFVWAFFGFVWAAFPQQAVKRLNRPFCDKEAARAAVSKETADMTRGFGISLVHPAAIELYASFSGLVDDETSAFRAVVLMRLVLCLSLVVGFVLFHPNDYYLVPGFYGAVASLTLPVVALVAI